MARNREVLGELVTDWLASDRSRRVVDVVVAQSSDAAFHCVSIIVFAWEDPAS